MKKSKRKQVHSRKNIVKLYYFAYFPQDNSFISFTLNAEEDYLNYRIISSDEPKPNSQIWKNLKLRIVSKAHIDCMDSESIYEMFCTENDPMLFLRTLYLFYKNLERKAEILLTEAETHIKIISDEAFSQL